MSNASTKKNVLMANDQPVLSKHAPNPVENSHDMQVYKPAQWNPLLVTIYAVVTFVVAQIAGIYIVSRYGHILGWSAARNQDWLSNSVVAQFWYVLLVEVLTFGAIAWYVRSRKQRLRDIGWLKFRFSDTGKAVLAFVVYLAIYLTIVSFATKLIPGLNVDQKQEIGFNNPVGGIDLLLTFISLVVLPPIVEETLFRGLLFTAFRSRMKYVVAAVIVSLLFAVPHAFEGGSGGLLWIGAIDTFTLSMVLCYLREKTGSLWAGVFTHALKNMLAFTSLYLIHMH